MKQLTLRLPDDLHALLKARAERERRSMHAEILLIIEHDLSRARIPPTPESDGPLRA